MMSFLTELRDQLRRDTKTKDSADYIVQLLAQQWGGCTVYVSKPGRLDEPVITYRDTPQTVAQRYQVSRRTAQRWLHRWKR